LAQAQPEVYRPAWALSLNNVAAALLLVGEARHALPPAEHASELYTALAARYSKTYQEHYGWCCRILAEILLESDNLEQALEKAHAAVALLGEMFSERPGHAPAQYGKALEVRARCQRAREGMTESLQTLRRAIRELGPHYERHPAALQTVMPKIVASLRSLAPASVAEEVSPTILDLLDRYPASFVPRLSIKEP
jgi:hypothetical protein